MSGEHKVVTVLSCDIVGSTALAELLGADVMHQAVDRFFKSAVELVARHGGTINQFLGDGFMALFRSDAASDDHALCAVVCAVELNRSLGENSAAIFGRAGVTVRQGVHSGPVIVGSIGENLRADYMAASDTTQLAARLQSAADPGTILISNATFTVVRAEVECRFRPARTLRNRPEIPAAQQIVRVLPGVDERLRETLRVRGAGAGTDSSTSYTPAHLAHKVLTSQSAMEGERKLVSVLFCDIAGSAAVAERIGGAAMHQAIEQVFKLAVKITARHDGTINQFLGEGFMALFGAPVAHEDHQQRAVMCALELNREFEERSATFFGEAGVRLRQGINTGMVVAGRLGDDRRMDYSAVGDTTNVAARLQGACEPGTILIGDSTFTAVRTSIECVSLGPRVFKGKSDAIPVHRVVRALSDAGRGGRGVDRGGAAPLVGRATELQRLRARIETLGGGGGGIALIIGEAGLGKSRLLAEAKTIALEHNCHWLTGNAVSFGQTLTYWPFLLLLRGYFEIQEQDSEPVAFEKLATKLRKLFPVEGDAFLPYIATMLALPLPCPLAKQVGHLDGLAMGHQVFRSALRLFERLAQLQPLIVVLDDWHWADRSSGDLLEHVLPLTERVPVVFIVSARPDPDTPAARLPAAIRDRGLGTRCAEIRLAPLSHDEAEGLSRHLLGNVQLPAAIRETLLTKVGGNPFFLEEMIRTLIALKVLEWDERAKTWCAASGLEQLQLPDNVQGVITARIDRLDDALKQLLKTASVIGESFFYRVLRAVAQSGAEIDEHLAGLQRLELVLERARFPELDYIFKHPLLKEAAYQSILAERRRSLHRRVGECVETLFAGRLEKFYAVLAWHYARAEEWDKAQEYLFKAGDQAGEIAGNAEAVDHYRQALAAAAKTADSRWTPLQRATLQRKMGEALFRLGDFQGALAELRASLGLLGAPYPISNAAVRLHIGREVALRMMGATRRWLGFTPHVPSAAEAQIAHEKFQAYLTIGHVHFTFDHERPLLDALSFTRSSEETGNPVQMAIGLGCLGTLVGMVGLHRLAAGYGRRATEFAEQSGNPMALGFAYHTRGVAEDCSGEYAAAVAHLERSSEHYRSVGHLHFWAGSRCFLAMALLSQGDPRTEQVARELLASGIETGDRAARGWGLLFIGIYQRQTADYAGAIATLESAIPVMESVPDRNCLSWVDGELAVCHARLGQFDRALARADAARAAVVQNRAAGFFALNPLGAVAEAWLLDAEHATDFVGGKAALMSRAHRACLAAARWARTIKSEWAAETPRLLGTWHWLAGRRSRAEREWRRGVALAERLGARHALAQTHLERGRRLRQQDDIAYAEKLFSDMGAGRHVARCRELSAH